MRSSLRSDASFNSLRKTRDPSTTKATVDFKFFIILVVFEVTSLSIYRSEALDFFVRKTVDGDVLVVLRRLTDMRNTRHLIVNRQIYFVLATVCDQSVWLLRTDKLGFSIWHHLIVATIELVARSNHHLLVSSLSDTTTQPFVLAGCGATYRLVAARIRHFVS